MKHRTIIAAIIGLAALGAMPETAEATTPRLAVMLSASLTQTYSANVEKRMRDARYRIATKIQTRRLSSGLGTQMLRDVDLGMGLIRQRIAIYGKDGRIDSVDNQQIHTLANAIAADLTKTYGSFDSWMLL
jgi:hypothetical protein